MMAPPNELAERWPSFESESTVAKRCVDVDEKCYYIGKDLFIADDDDDDDFVSATSTSTTDHQRRPHRERIGS